MMRLGNERDSLNSLTETHLVSENTIDARLVKTDHPVETVQLVVAQQATLEHSRLLSEAREHVLLLLVLIVALFSAHARLLDVLLERLRSSLGHALFAARARGALTWRLHCECSVSIEHALLSCFVPVALVLIKQELSVVFNAAEKVIEAAL